MRLQRDFFVTFVTLGWVVSGLPVLLTGCTGFIAGTGYCVRSLLAGDGEWSVGLQFMLGGLALLALTLVGLIGHFLLLRRGLLPRRLDEVTQRGHATIYLLPLLGATYLAELVKLVGRRPALAIMALALLAIVSPGLPLAVSTLYPSLTVTSTPASAEVRLGDERVGQTPVTFTLLPRGRQTVVVRLPGYQPETRELNLQREQSLSVTLHP